MKMVFQAQTLKIAFLTGGFFFLAFWVLGYSQLFSGFLGLIGAIAAGWIAAWWNSPDQQRQPANEEEESIKTDKPPKQTGIIATQRRMKAIREKRRLRDRASERIFSWLKRR